MSIESNKENISPVYTNKKKKKKKNSTERKMKRSPLADITHLFDNSSTLTTTREEHYLKASFAKSEQKFRNIYDSKRLSPQGPDPRHH
ncbi:hypothetical protein MTR_2g091120 [Medicago truncatula]|uniref:Uncharacterized protein n=1 Tax=Medicago truncatula TaxID=3880 RepID=A0A072VM78_MEDTR|nr:hypothetical protein MTR_2g091120 [Medicago truncatula]